MTVLLLEEGEIYMELSSLVAGLSGYCSPLCLALSAFSALSAKILMFSYYLRSLWFSLLTDSVTQHVRFWVQSRSSLAIIFGSLTPCLLLLIFLFAYIFIHSKAKTLPRFCKLRKTERHWKSFSLPALPISLLWWTIRCRIAASYQSYLVNFLRKASGK